MMHNGDRKRLEEEELTRKEGRKDEEKRENARNIEKRDGRERTRRSARRRGNIRRQSPGRVFGPSHEIATSSLSFIRINLLNVSPTITHAIKLTAL